MMFIDLNWEGTWNMTIKNHVHEVEDGLHMIRCSGTVEGPNFFEKFDYECEKYMAPSGDPQGPHSLNIRYGGCLPEYIEVNVADNLNEITDRWVQDNFA